MHRYFPHTQQEIAAMLERCGMSELRELYSDVPKELLLAAPYNLPSQKSETEVRNYFNSLAERNTKVTACFAGNGFYHHYVPAVALSLIGRSEFLTAYTPYQPEISQGTLQYIFEYQTMMCRLTGLPVSNASMYDGATATAEAMMMAVAAGKKRRRVLVSATLNEAVRRVVDTYAHYHDVPLTTIPEADGAMSTDSLNQLLEAHDDVAGVIVAQPNRYGIIEDFTGVADAVHARKALLIMNCIAADLSTLRTPGEWGADIACGDAQSLGIPLNFGGPYLGYLCCTQPLMRKMPGRIVGATTDANGNRCFVLTLQAREQHIRRDKATSNICSNQGLMTLYVTIYMSLLGAAGLREVSYRGHQCATYLLQSLTAAGGCRLKYPNRPVLNEFLLEMDCDVDLLLRRCLDEGILAGVKTGDHELLIAATEMQTREDVDRYVAVYKSIKQ
jgi:glycine dehydrogenase subunit 1